MSFKKHLIGSLHLSQYDQTGELSQHYIFDMQNYKIEKP